MKFERGMWSQTVLPLGLFAILWLDLVRQLSYEWRTNEQYAFGWFVPLLAVAMLLKKWPARPPRGETCANPSPGTRAGGWLWVLVVGGALAWLPLRVIHEINQDWPLISWPLALVAVGLSLYAVFLHGGWPWVRHFGFPILFILAAVQWPYRIEHGLTQGLMRLVAGLSVEILGWLDVAANQKGNLIEVSTGTVGVDEACSGIRSFLSTLMVSLALGELYRLRWLVRCLLVGVGLFVAFWLNVFRALFLTWQAERHGLGAVERWHDAAGLTIVVGCFFALWGLVMWLTRKSAGPTTGKPAPAVAAAGAAPGAPLPACGGGIARPVGWYLAAVGGWALLCLGLTEGWYRYHEWRRPSTARWWVSYPTNQPSFRPLTVSRFAAKLLRHDAESSGAWEEADGSQWTVYCFRWKAGDPTARMAARGHRPEYCLVGSGHEMLASGGIQYYAANGVELPFRAYTFDTAGRPLHVFFCLWEDGAEIQAGFGKSKYGDRLRSVWAGCRGMGQQTLELICGGYPDAQQAEQAAREMLARLIVREPPEVTRAQVR